MPAVSEGNQSFDADGSGAVATCFGELYDLMNRCERVRCACYERTVTVTAKSMSEHKATLKWARGDAEFTYQKYPRDHTWSFDGGHTMTATAAPAYLGNPAHVDPEEAFVAALASCHML